MGGPHSSRARALSGATAALGIPTLWLSGPHGSVLPRSLSSIGRPGSFYFCCATNQLPMLTQMLCFPAKLLCICPWPSLKNDLSLSAPTLTYPNLMLLPRWNPREGTALAQQVLHIALQLACMSIGPVSCPISCCLRDKVMWFSESFSLSTQARTSPTRSEIYLKLYLQLISYKHCPFKASYYFLFILWSLLRISWRLPQKSFAVSGNMQWGTYSTVFIYFSICFPTRR